MSESAVVSGPASSGLFLYKDGVLPWGETGRAAESRLSKLGMWDRWSVESEVYRQSHGCSLNEARFEVLKNYAPGAPVFTASEVKSVVEEPDAQVREARFLECCRAGLRIALPGRCSIDKMVNWVCENVNRDLPDVQHAPSYGSISLLMDARRDDSIRSKLWSIVLTKRMSPGDVKVKGGKAFKEDVEAEEAASDAHLDELAKRMFGEAT